MSELGFTGSTWWVSEHDAEIVDQFYVTQMLWWQGYEQMLGPMLVFFLVLISSGALLVRYVDILSASSLDWFVSTWLLFGVCFGVWVKILSPKMYRWEWEGYCLMDKLEDRDLALALRRCDYKMSPRFWEYAHKIKVRKEE